MRVKTAVGDKRPMALRVRTGVVRTGLLRKLYEQREVRVLYNPPKRLVSPVNTHNKVLRQTEEANVIVASSYNAVVKWSLRNSLILNIEDVV